MDKIWNVKTIGKNIEEYGLDEAVNFIQQLKCTIEAALETGNEESIEESINDYIDFTNALIDYLMVR